MKRVLVIGNGFDLDAGFNTTYNTFANSHFNDKNFEYSKMFLFLRQKHTECLNKNWFNFEDEIGQYVLSIGNKVSPKDVDADCRYHHELCYHLMMSMQNYSFTVPYFSTPEYIRENGKDTNEVNPAYLLRGKSQSIANRMLDFISQKPTYFDSIINFNYSNLPNLLMLRVADNVKFNQKGIEYYSTKLGKRVHHIHLKKDDSGQTTSVLGINDEIHINSDYEFVRKRNQAIISERECVISDISSADELIIFGHSLGEADKEYFRQFFRNLYNQNDIESDDKDVTFITYDDNRSIINNLNKIAGYNVIFNHNFVNHTHFIYTKVEESHICYMDLVNHLQDLHIPEHTHPV